MFGIITSVGIRIYTILTKWKREDNLIIDMRYNAVYQKHGKWYLGWIEEVPGVNTQGSTLAEAKENLKEALMLVLEVGKKILEEERPRGRMIRERIAI